MRAARNIRFDQYNRPRKFLGKPAKWLLPDAAARAYFYDLNILVNYLIELTNKFLIPALPSLTRQANALRPDHFDAYPDEIKTIIEGMEIQYLEVYTPEKVEAVAGKAAVNINQFNSNQFQKVMKSVIGVDVFIAEPWLQNEMKSFIADNTALIKSLSSDYFTQIETITFRDLRAGKRHEEIAADIRARYGVTKNRAKLIARDQTNKFNGQLTQLRQQNAGIKEYIWQTAGDNRVRLRHQDRDGKTFKWSDPPADGHPGEAVQCRCFAEPIITSAVAERFTGEPIRERRIR